MYMPVVEELKRGRPSKAQKDTAEAAPIAQQTEEPVKDSIEKPKAKRVMSEAQLANLEKGRAARAVKFGTKSPVQAEEPEEVKKQKKAPRVIYESESESEEEVVIVKKKKAQQKAKPKKRIIYESESEEEVQSRHAVPASLVPKQKRTYTKRKAAAAEPVQQQQPQTRHVEIRQPMGFLRFV